MNRRQKTILSLGVILFVAAALYPPWYSKVASHAPRDLGYRVLFSPPAVAPGSEYTGYIGRVDFDRLGVEWAIIAVITGTLLLVYASGKEKMSRPPSQ